MSPKIPPWRRQSRIREADVDADIDDELRFHLEMRESELRAGGMDPTEARKAARAFFGDPAEVRKWLRRHDRRKAERRERRALAGALLQDLAYGIRKLAKQPGFTAAAVLTLGLGIGGATAVFSAVDGILVRPLPFADDARLVTVDLSLPIDAPVDRPSAMPDATYLDRLRDAFMDWGAYATGGLNLTDLGEPVRVRVAMVTPGFFSTLGVAPATGRPFTGEDVESGGTAAAILSDGLARRHFADPASALGRTIRLNDRSYQIVGTMPRGFGFPSEAEVWLPMQIPFPLTDFEAFRQYLPSTAVARLAPGMTITGAERRVRSLYSKAGQAERIGQRSVGFVWPFRERFVRDRRTGVVFLFGATLLVLLVACANVANLLLSQATARESEIAMRVLLGASRRRIVQQLVVESLLLAATGGALGVAVAHLAMPPLRTLVPEVLVGAVTVGVDPRVLAFGLLLVLGTTLGFGLWPALTLAKAEPADAARASACRATGARRTIRVRRAMVVGEIATAMILLVGTGVMLRSFDALLSVDSGVRPDRVGTLELSLSRTAFPTGEERRAFVQEVLGRLEADSRVESAAFVNELPLRGSGGVMVTVRREGQEEADARALPMALDLQVSPGYFEALGIPLLRGRTLRAATGSEPAGEVVINQRLAELLWPGRDPIGMSLVRPFGESVQVVGVVGDVKWRALDEDLVPQTYTELLPSPYPNLALVGRSELPADELAQRLAEAVRAVDADQAVYNVRSMEDVISGPIAPRRTTTLLVSVFGGVALVLAAIGVYGIVAYDVARRAREFGIRLAVGARPRQLLRQVVGDGLRMGLAGVMCGLFGAWMLVGALRSLVFGISPRDPVAFVAAPVVLLSIALLGVLAPGMGVARMDPTETIRAE